jgi:hypothetical protein
MIMKTKPEDFASFWQQIEKIITSVPSTDTVFNQYRHCNAEVDLPNGASIRMANLRAYMAKATKTASMLVVGEAAGPWGCRFSGVPFTGEVMGSGHGKYRILCRIVLK